jgi:hypothetical protein
LREREGGLSFIPDGPDCRNRSHSVASAFDSRSHTLIVPPRNDVYFVSAYVLWLSCAPNDGTATPSS